MQLECLRARGETGESVFGSLSPTTGLTIHRISLGGQIALGRQIALAKSREWRLLPLPPGEAAGRDRARRVRGGPKGNFQTERACLSDPRKV